MYRPIDFFPKEHVRDTQYCYCLLWHRSAKSILANGTQHFPFHQQAVFRSLEFATKIISLAKINLQPNGFTCRRPSTNPPQLCL